MRRLLTIIVVLLATFAVARAQEFAKEPEGGMWAYSDGALTDCVMNIGLFDKGFYWVSREGYSWWVLENPILRIGDTQLLQVNAFLYYDVLALARQQGWPVHESLDSYLRSCTPGSTDSHPPVFLQSDKRDKARP